MDQTQAITPGQFEQRPRTRSRGISFKSDRSGNSDNRLKAVESPRDKAQRDSVWAGTSKANPNAAVNEAQPSVANVIEQSTLSNLREKEGQYRDVYGNVINDPDRSNPTRPRLERPLDTIRSFEKAIDDGYKRRSSYVKPDSESWDKENQFASRRSSYYNGEYALPKKGRSGANIQAGYDNGPSPNRGPHGGNGGYYGSQSHHGPPRTRYGNNRIQSDSQLYGAHRTYQQHGHHQSHDTVNTGITNGSDSTGPWGNSTDPSSENSSIDKVHAMNKPPTPVGGYDRYGNGYNGPIMEEQGGANQYGEYQQENGYGRPSPPEHGYPQQNGYNGNASSSQLQQPAQARRPIQLGGGSSTGTNGVSQSSAPPPPPSKDSEQKKGWIKRRFSKKN